MVPPHPPQRPEWSAAQPVPGAGPSSAQDRCSHFPWQPLPLDWRAGLGQRDAGCRPVPDTHWLPTCLELRVRALNSGLIVAAGTQSPCSVPPKRPYL